MPTTAAGAPWTWLLRVACSKPCRAVLSASGEPAGRGAGSKLRALSRPLSPRRERQAGGGGSGGSAQGPRLVLSAPNTVTNLHGAAPTGPEAAECLVCSDLALLVLFSPCQHRTVCEGECGVGRGARQPGWTAPHSTVASPRRVRTQDEEVHQVPGGHQQEAAPRWGPAPAPPHCPQVWAAAPARGPARCPRPRPLSWLTFYSRFSRKTSAPSPRP